MCLIQQNVYSITKTGNLKVMYYSLRKVFPYNRKTNSSLQYTIFDRSTWKEEPDQTALYQWCSRISLESRLQRRILCRSRWNDGRLF